MFLQHPPALDIDLDETHAVAPKLRDALHRALALHLVQCDAVADGVGDDETPAAGKIGVGHLQIRVLRGDIVKWADVVKKFPAKAQ